MSAKKFVCVVASRAHASRVVGHLVNAGFSVDSISALCPDARILDGSMREKEAPHPQRHLRGESLAMVLGGGFAWLTGFGVLTVAGIGKLIIAGAPLVAMLGKPDCSGIAGALAEMGMPDHAAGHFESQIKSGGTLVCVLIENETEMIAARCISQALGVEAIIPIEGD